MHKKGWVTSIFPHNTRVRTSSLVKDMDGDSEIDRVEVDTGVECVGEGGLGVGIDHHVVFVLTVVLDVVFLPDTIGGGCVWGQGRIMYIRVEANEVTRRGEEVRGGGARGSAQAVREREGGESVSSDAPVGYQRHGSVLPEDCQTGNRGLVASAMCAECPRNVHTPNVGAHMSTQRREGWLGLWNAKGMSSTDNGNRY